MIPPLAEPDMVHADAIVETAGEQSPSLSAREPAALPPSADAAPLSQDGQAALRAVLESELADLAPADRDVWLDVLEGLPAADAVGIVRLWKKFGSGPGLLSESHRADAPPESLVPSILLPTPTTSRPFSDPGTPTRSARTDLHEAREFVARNLLNAGTVGYHRLEPLFAVPPLHSPAPESVSGHAVATRRAMHMFASRIDHRSGAMIESASPLDFAIEGDGFFVVTHPAGRFYTRCGRFSRDAEGRLALTTSHGDLPVAPEIKVPGDCTALTVTSNGEVTVFRESGEPDIVGTLLLALFVAPAQLNATDDALFTSSERSGAPQLGRPYDGLRGGVLQRRLESSNVDVVQETTLLGQIDESLELIQDAHRQGHR
jgi:flagellar basal-body rod protein FlgG